MPPISGNYVKYESSVIDGDSGGGVFIKDGPEWKLASLLTLAGGDWTYSGGPRISYWQGTVNWIDTKIAEMGGTRPSPPSPITIEWQGTNSTDWETAANWDVGVPLADDVVAIDVVGNPPATYTSTISTGDAAVAKELMVGNEGTGELALGGTGTLTIDDGLYLGLKSAAEGTLTISGGTLSSGILEVGVHGTGTLDINNNVNEADLDLFLGCMSGANVPADLDCMD